MTLDAVLIMIFGLSMTWGGALFCIYITFRKKNDNKNSQD